MPRIWSASWRTSSTRATELDAAALAAAAGVDLRLDHPDRAAEGPGGLLGLLGRVGDPALEHGDAVVGEQRLGLVFVDVHRISSPFWS
jgi:hypothetical protein